MTEQTLYARCRNVVFGCVTSEQYAVARRFCELAVKSSKTGIGDSNRIVDLIENSDDSWRVYACH